jgi:hypothetical protein
VEEKAGFPDCLPSAKSHSNFYNQKKFAKRVKPSRRQVYSHKLVLLLTWVKMLAG